MQAVIIAGGKGTRLSTITNEIPKAMIPIAGKPLLEYQIEDLKKSGVDNIIIAVGFLGDVIRDHFGDGSSFGVNITYYTEDTPLGTAGALVKIKERLEDTFLLLLGDLFIDFDLNRLYEYHIAKSADITLFVHPNTHPFDSDIVITNKDNRIIGWSYKKDVRTEDYKNLVNGGLYVIQRTVIDNIERKLNSKGVSAIDLEKDLIIPLISTDKVYAYRSTEYLMDIGTPDRLERASLDYQNGVCDKRSRRHKQKCIFLDRDGTINRFAGLIKNADQIELEPGAAEAIRLINESGYLAIVITNQPVIARGECTYAELDRIHNRIETLLGQECAYIDGLYFCPHHPDSGFKGEITDLKINCDCRKPKTGMIKAAEKDYNADLINSWFVGDTTTDVMTGKNAGMRTIMLRNGNPQKDQYDATPDAIADDILDAIRMILSGEG